MNPPAGWMSVQARLLDLLRGPAVELNLAVVIVTHDLGVARLLANRLLVMKQGRGGEWLNRPGARRSAPSLHPAAGVVGVAELMLFCRVAAAPYPAHRCVIRRPGKRSATRQLNLVRANMIRVENVHKTFVLHQQHGVRLPVLADASLTVNAGECVVLHGHPAAANRPCCVRCTPIICRTAAISISATATNGWTRSPPPHARCWKCANHHRLGQPVSTGDPAHFGAGGGDAAAARSWDAARSAAAPAPDPPQRSGTPVAPCAVHLFRRRAAAGQHRPRFCSRLSDPAPDEPTASLDGKNSAAVVNLIHDAKERRGHRGDFP